MKTIQSTKFIVLLLSLGMFVSCVQDDDFDIPSSIGEEPELPAAENVLQIADVINLYEQNGGEQYTFEETGMYMEGYVVSSDEAGNFYREMILQDKPESPTAGIRVGLFVNDLYTKYNFGRKIYIALDDFSVGVSNGVVTLGIPDGNFMDEAPAAFEDKIIRSAEIAEITPLPIEISDFSDQYENLYVEVSNVQFPASAVLGENPLSFAGENNDEFDGEREVTQCETGESFVLSTSTFADFKSQDLPAGNGTMSGILSRNFEDSFYVMVINDTSDLMFDQERCGGDVLCEGPAGGSFVVFEDDFESYSNIGDAENAGWTNINVSGGSTEFVLGNFDNTQYAQISGFNSDEAEIVTYLVSPAINMDNTTDEALTFDLEVAYANGRILKVLATENYTGDVQTTEWTEIAVEIPNQPSNGFGGFNNVGDINVSCLNGDVHFAFMYEGSDPESTTRYHIDNFEVNGVEM